MQEQIDGTAAQRDERAKQLEVLDEQVKAAGRAPAGQPTVVFPLYRFTPEEDYADAQERCTKGR